MHEIDKQLSHMLKGNFKEAKKISDKLHSIGPEKILDAKGKNTLDIWLRHLFNRGWFFLQEGDFQTGSKMLESGRHLSVYGGPPLQTNAPMFNPEQHSIKDKTIILNLEGGYGDEIIHVRFVQSYKNLGAKKVIVACCPELKSVFSRVPGVDAVIQRDEAHMVAHDYWIPGFSAGWISGHTYENLPNDPYIFSNDMSIQIWSGVVCSEKKRVGIRWAGNPKFEHQQFRRFPTEFMFELAKYDEVQLYSLQRDNNLETLPENIIDLQKWLVGWEDTIAAIHHMDLVITSCTSIAHISAALGKETWVLPPILPYNTWTYGAPDSNTSPWYKSVTLFRQKEYQKWNSTFQELYRAFEDKFKLEHIEHPNHDKEAKKLNLGCGYQKLPEYLNVDRSHMVEPDLVWDLNKTPWPWKDNEFDHIVMKDILEHLGSTPDEFLNIIKELYRISRNGAILEIQTPHWRSDNLLNDPTHIRAITPKTLEMFNMKHAMWLVKNQSSTSSFAFDLDIDFEICDIKYDFTELFNNRIKSENMTKEDVEFLFNTMNNVAESVKILIEVYKPGRYNIQEYKQAWKEKYNDINHSVKNVQQ